MNMILNMNARHHKSQQDADASALVAGLLRRYDAARQDRQPWERLWDECYDYALPERGEFLTWGDYPGRRRPGRVYDGTALDAADRLAASLLGHLTPIWSQWFGLKPGPDLSEAEASRLSPVLERTARIVQDHFDRSNFAVEIHQCYLDLVVGGTASLFFEEAEPGAFSAFRFSAVPLMHAVLEEGDSGMLDISYRQTRLTLAQISARYPGAALPSEMLRRSSREPHHAYKILEAVMPEQGAFAYYALLTEDGFKPALLASARLERSPVIAFRWAKAPGETYGRSPVMGALPDIKTANKVVELILKNATIAVTGMWQADDDGVLNPANIDLSPGAIIPKAVGSNGLQPLQMPGNFDVSQLVLDGLQSRIRHALLSDRLAPVTGPRMTATEVMERSAEMSMLLGATYGRLQSELLTPLIQRAFSILRRRGEIPDIALDGRTVMIDYRSPLARSQGQRSVQNTLGWISSVLSMGPEAAAAIDLPRAARFLGEAMGVPSDLIRRDMPLPPEVLSAETV